jgi:hypothetical protein
MGASGSTQSLAAASRMTHFDNQAYCMYAFPVQTICSQMAWQYELVWQVSQGSHSVAHC